MIGHKIIYIAGHDLNLIKEIFLDSNHLNKDGIRIHTSTELEEMKLSCKLAAETLDMIGDFVKPGISTEKIWYYQLDVGRNMGKTNPLNQDDLSDFVEIVKTREISKKSWIVKENVSDNFSS